jgi:hypothetical protein
MGVNVTFGIIVLNGEPFTRYCIHSLYPHAHEIIVVEGACLAARNVATKDGHSRDNTLNILKNLKEFEDPSGKIKIVTAEDEGHPDGFWPGEKLEQSQAYAKRTTGDYLWQVDIDEFYQDKDIQRVKDLLSGDTTITCISFKQLSFWGGFEYLVDSWYLKRFLSEIYRVFKWGQGYNYITHRPPTVINNAGISLKDINCLSSDKTERLGIYMYHYSFVFPKQIDEKVEYYHNVDWAKQNKTKWWAEEVYYKFKFPCKAFINTDYPGWIEKIDTRHPIQIQHLINDLEVAFPGINLRPTNDLESKTNSQFYRLSIVILKVIYPVYFYSIIYYKSLKRKLRKIF